MIKSLSNNLLLLLLPLLISFCQTLLSFIMYYLFSDVHHSKNKSVLSNVPDLHKKKIIYLCFLSFSNLFFSFFVSYLLVCACTNHHPVQITAALQQPQARAHWTQLHCFFIISVRSFFSVYTFYLFILCIHFSS